jgi:NAD(P)H-dependent flavin oxidoreductase YrpB (nitropropane dioxygenase family)
MAAAAVLPSIIQGGMGVGVSNWRLARAVSERGHLGVVSGTCLDTVLIRRLADGDPGGHVRQALDAFPIPKIAQDVLDRFFQPEGRVDTAYPLLPMYRHVVSEFKQQVTVLANFVEVFLAKHGHDGQVGINLLTKVQMPNLPSLYGAILAGVDYVLMGAGIPKDIPLALEQLAKHLPASIRLDVEGCSQNDPVELQFDPESLWDGPAPEVSRPRFLPIVASNSLATMLAKKASGRVDGFIVEGPTAGGHNAPPRGQRVENEKGEPLYTERDVVDLDKLARLGLPFWLAGGAGRPGALRRAKDAGAQGIQVGTLFAFCDESGLEPDIRAAVVERSLTEKVDVLTDGRASPTGFPFKVVQMGDSLASQSVYEKRDRICDLGYLRTAYRQPSGRLGFRCPAEPVETYVKKGGAREDTVGRKCLCNALMADIGHGQLKSDGSIEPHLLTAGDDLMILHRFLDGRTSYSAADVLDFLLDGVETREAAPTAAAAGATGD